MAVAGLGVSVVQKKGAAWQHRTYSGILRIEPSLYSENRKKQRHYLTTIKFCNPRSNVANLSPLLREIQNYTRAIHFVVNEQITINNGSTTPLFGSVNAMSRIPTKDGGAAFPKPMPVISVSDLQGRR